MVKRKSVSLFFCHTTYSTGHSNFSAHDGLWDRWHNKLSHFLQGFNIGIFFNSGWAAVLANLEDITQDFRTRVDHFNQSFSQHLETRAEYMKLLHK